MLERRGQHFAFQAEKSELGDGRGTNRPSERSSLTAGPAAFCFGLRLPFVSRPCTQNPRCEPAFSRNSPAVRDSRLSLARDMSTSTSRRSTRKPSSGAASSGRSAKKRGGSRRARGGSASKKTSSSNSGIRLQRVLAEAGIASRRRSEELITQGEVKVNGRVVTTLGTRVDLSRDKVTFRGRSIRAAQKVYFVLNKPDGVVCSAQGPIDERGRPTVISLMKGVPQRVYPVGRLDYHTRGVLIVTNDGSLSSYLTHPRSGVVKTYHVKFQGKLSPQDKELLAQGVTLEDGTKTAPAAECLPLRETATNSWIQLGIRQGLNRQIRRMGEAIGHPVLKLIRVAVGEITADGLAEGEFRRLSTTEVAQLGHADVLADER